MTKIVKKRKGYTQGFVTDVDGATYVVKPNISRRVEDDAFVLLISVVSARGADRSQNNEQTNYCGDCMDILHGRLP